MANQFGLAKMMLGRCPSCYYNFRSLFCAMTCSADHSRFLLVKDTGTSTLYPGRETVESINYTLAGDYAERLLTSCRFVDSDLSNNTFCFRFRDVLYPGGNQHSLDSMCGKPYDKCTKEDFMYYLGVGNPQVPFPIYIGFPNETSEEYGYYNQTTFACDEPLISRYENKTSCGCLVSEMEKGEKEMA